VAIGAVAILAAGTVRFIRLQYHSAQDRSINQLIESSRDHEGLGRLDQALIDLDAALELARKAGAGYLAKVDDWQKKRSDLARRDGETVLDRLHRAGPTSFSLGNWLNLIARAKRDPDLSPISTQINEQFQLALNQEVEFDFAAARRALESGEVVSSFIYCDRIAGLIRHLPPEKQLSVRSEAESVVSMLVSAHGVTLVQPRGHFLFGPQTYVSELVPVLVKALEAKGYLPCRETSPWRHQWIHALYQLDLEISESLEGTYLSSPNRLTRIEARLTLMSHGQTKWRTTPTVTSTVPLPKLPAYLSTRVEISQERSQDVEKLLYDSARGQIHEKLAYALSNMPSCPRPQASSGP